MRLRPQLHQTVQRRQMAAAAVEGVHHVRFYQSP
jgi:hypothetical protein